MNYNNRFPALNILLFKRPTADKYLIPVGVIGLNFISIVGDSPLYEDTI